MKDESNLEKIKIKLKKLIALSKSSNANEAALALEMAQKLMMEYGIKRNEVGEFEVIEENIKGNSGEKPPKNKVEKSLQSSLFNEPLKQSISYRKRRCKHCKHIEKWACGGSFFYYCGISTSNRTKNGLAKVKLNKLSCGAFQLEVAK